MTPSANDSDSVIDELIPPMDFTQDVKYMKGAPIGKELTKRLMSSDNKNPLHHQSPMRIK